MLSPVDDNATLSVPITGPRDAGYRQHKRRLYSRKWEKLREHHLANNPLCARHAARGEVVGATIVHHVRPHRGDLRLLMDAGNLESLCKRCHDSDAQREERAAESNRPRIGADGFPIDGSW
jgi:5-methylcytosine-specific restriction endonuclease McrA